MFIDPFRRRFLRAPEDGAGAGILDAGAAGNPPPPAGEGAAGGGAPEWWSGLDADTTAFVQAKGLKGKPVDEALRSTLGMYRSAETMLGKKGIPAPEKGSDPSDWMVQNRDALGLPADATGYDVKIPEGFDEASWDKGLAERATSLAVTRGVPPSVHQGYVNLFAEYVQGIDKQAAEAEEKANTEMTAALEKDWGKETDTRIAGARQAAQRLAEQAGLDNDALRLVGSTLTKELGGAPVLRLFDALARAMSDDTLGAGAGEGGGLDGGAADAKSRLDALQSPGGEYYEAVRKGDTMKVNELAPMLRELQKQVSGKKR